MIGILTLFIVMGPTIFVTEALLLIPVGLISTPWGLTRDGADIVRGLLRFTGLAIVEVGLGMLLGTTIPVALVTIAVLL